MAIDLFYFSIRKTFRTRMDKTQIYVVTKLLGKAKQSSFINMFYLNDVKYLDVLKYFNDFLEFYFSQTCMAF